MLLNVVRTKKLLLLILLVVSISCGTVNQSSLLPQEGQLSITRKYAGIFMDYRHTSPESFSGINIIWIKTSMDSVYGKISAYGKKCDFSVGDRLYLTRTYYTFGDVSGYWEYHIENDSSIYYRLTEFQHDRKIMVQTWF